jgi:site-specific recombinase XerD
MFVIHPHLKVEQDFAQSFLLSEYISHLRIQGLSLYTIESYNDFLVRFIRFSQFQDYHDFDSILKLKYAYYALTKRKMMNSSLLKYYKIIKKYSEFLKDNELIEKVHINQIPRVRVSASLPKSLSEEDVVKIRKCVMTMKSQSPFLQMRNAMILETFLYTGIRREELARLRKENIFPHHIIIEQ